MKDRPLTYSERTSEGIKFYGIIYLDNGHTFFCPATSRSAARRKALGSRVSN